MNDIGAIILCPNACRRLLLHFKVKLSAQAAHSVDQIRIIVHFLIVTDTVVVLHDLISASRCPSDRLKRVTATMVGVNYKVHLSARAIRQRSQYVDLVLDIDQGE